MLSSSALTQVRPYISLNGARKSGPKAKDMRNTDSVIAMIVGFVMPSGNFRMIFRFS